MVQQTAVDQQADADQTHVTYIPNEVTSSTHAPSVYLTSADHQLSAPLPTHVSSARSHTNNENPLNDHRISSQQQDNTGRFESARNLTEDVSITRTEVTPHLEPKAPPQPTNYQHDQCCP